MAITAWSLKETGHLLNHGTMPAPAHMSSKFITQIPLEIQRRSRQSPAVHLLLRQTCAAKAHETRLAARCVGGRRATTLPPLKLRPTL